MRTEDFDYDLPPGRVAQKPLAKRDHARLLVDRGIDHAPSDHRISDLPGLLAPGDLVVVNDTRVLPARLAVRRSSGANGEVLLLSRDGLRDGWWEALVRPSRRVRVGETVQSTRVEGFSIEVGDDLGEGRRLVRLLAAGSARCKPEDLDAELAMLQSAGEMPLPPYVHEPLADPERYQTVYGRQPGSVAAPTAGLHLSGASLRALEERGVEVATLRLDIGLGTFRPIATELVDDHVMHRETYDIPPATLDALDRVQAADTGRVVAIGTTTLRALETFATTGQRHGSTALFIRRPHTFEVVDVLLTNFHLPRSSLLVLVDAFVGPRWRELYGAALDRGYRFLSFGDAMLLEHATTPTREDSS